ncbi:MAG: glycosyltransferase [Edaphocola sp.]
MLWKIPQEQKQRATKEPTSIIVCAKNEAANLSNFLPAILLQAYPPHLYEVIVVNDASTDDTDMVLAKFSQQYAHLNIVNIPQEATRNLPGKKYALQQGIKAAKCNRLLLTDADCKPGSEQWLGQMSNTDAPIVLGYGAYENRPGVLNKFIRWETVNTCMQYAGYAAQGMPYMGVGRNLCYDKTLLNQLPHDTQFNEVYAHTPSGDDDLLVARIANKGNTAVCINPQAQTISLPKTTWATWWHQKKRHGSTGKYYPERIKLLLGLYGLSHALYWFLGFPIVFFGLQIDGNCNIVSPTTVLVGLSVVRLSLYWINALRWYRFLGEKKLAIFYPLGDLGWALYNVLLSPFILWKNKQDWK